MEHPNDLQPGQRVVLSTECPEYDEWFYQHEGGQGVIANARASSDWTSVDWDNGISNYFYPIKYLIPVYEPERTDKVSIKLKKGQRVRPNPDHEDYEIYYERQHKGEDGTVQYTNDHSSMPIIVRWDNGHQNSYKQEMLIPIDESTPKEPLSEDQLPLLPGQRVCLNPESRVYEELNEACRGTSGYVIGLENDKILEKRWITLSQRQRNDIVMNVKFDNDRTLLVRKENLLLIEAPSITVERYVLKNRIGRKALTVVNGDKLEQDEVDKRIFKQGHTVESKTTYDNEWRAKIIEQINR